MDGEREERKFEGPTYAELGEVVKPEEIDEDFLGPEPTIPTGDDDEELEPGAVTYGNKIDKNNTSCYYYMEVKYCNERKKISDKIAKVLKEIDDINDDMQEDNISDSRLESLNNQLNRKEAEKNELEVELNEHISNVCEANEAKAKSWCNGFKICLGHRTHYKCNGHKVVLCLGHTSINVAIKTLYRDELLDEAFKVFR